MKKHSKVWNEIKTNDSWSIFKIMGEFVHGYEQMSSIGPCVCIFGSARIKPETPYYERIGLHYTLPWFNGLMVGVNVKAHKTKADLTEVVVGVPIRL